MEQAPRSPQLALDFRWNQGADMASLVAGPNSETVLAVRSAAAGRCDSMHVHGGAGEGKSHLLQAACGVAAVAGRTAFYLPLAELCSLSPEVVQGQERVGLIAIDSLDAIAGDAAWEEALFHLYNRHREAGGTLITAARQPPESIGLTLADLASRLQWGPVYRMRPLADDDRREALHRRARQRGLELPPASANYLLSRFPRDTAALLELFDRLDEASLRAGRRLTVPFIRETLSDSPHD